MKNRRINGLAIFLALVLSAVLLTSVAPATAQELPGPPTPAYIQLTAEPAEITADGSSTANITARVWDGEDWIAWGFDVSFSTDLGEITELVPLNDTATATLTAGTTAGTATITAEVDLSAVELDVLTNTTTVVFTAPGTSPTPSGGSGGGGGGGGGSSGGTTTPTPTTSPTTSPGESPAPTAAPTSTASPSVAPSGTPGATIAPTAPTAPTAPSTPAAATAEPTPKEPGFEAVFAISGCLAVAYLLMGRRAR